MPDTLSTALQIAADEDDKLEPVGKVAEMVTGTRPHPTTTSRWCRRGTSGVLLPSLVVAGKRMTSRKAYAQFLRDVTAKRNAV